MVDSTTQTITVLFNLSCSQKLDLLLIVTQVVIAFWKNLLKKEKRKGEKKKTQTMKLEINFPEINH